MKKLVSTFLSIVMLFALTAPAFATESNSTATADSCTTTTETQSQIIPRNIQSFNLQNVGDTQILTEDEEGVLFIELTDEHETVSNVARAGITREVERNYTIYHKNWLGNQEAVVEVTAKVTWIDNGANSYIQNLHGEYNVKNDDFSCVWNSDYQHSSDYLHYLTLDIYHGVDIYVYMLSASLVFTDADCTIPKIIMDMDAYG